MRLIDRLAQKEKLLLPTDKAVEEAIYTFKDHTALGMDMSSPRFWKWLPPRGRQHLAEFIRDCQRQRAWPWQLLSTMVVLAGKPKGDDERPLGLINNTVRLWTRTQRPSTRAWCAARAKHWDHPLAGSSALRSALLTAMRVELAEINNSHWVLLLFDLEKFYDCVCLAALVKATLNNQFSPTIFVMLVQVYLAPRVIQSGRCCAEPIFPTNSLVAGCGEANNMARVTLFDAIELLLSQFPATITNTFVDDVKQFTASPCLDELLCVASAAATEFARQVAKAQGACGQPRA